MPSVLFQAFKLFYHKTEKQQNSMSRFESDSALASDKQKRDVRKGPNLSGPLMLPTRASANSLSAPIRSSGGYRIYRKFIKPCRANMFQNYGVSS